MDDAPPAIGPRRTILDSILVNAAVAAGAELRQGFAVSELLTEGGLVVGIRGQSQGHKSVQERAQIVIGADGKHSKIAQLVQSPSYNAVPSLTCWYYTYWSGLPCEGLELHWRHHQVVFTFPTNNELVFTAVAVPQQYFHAFRHDIEGSYRQAVARIPSLADRLNAARRETRFYGMADVPNFLRKPYGPGWALVGDASHHKDPVPAHGISDAFCDAELLVQAIHAGLSGEQPLAEALAQYEQNRNARAIPAHEQCIERAHLEQWDSPEALHLRDALRGNAEDTAGYFAVVALASPPERFFAPENLKRILNQANVMSERP
jgi:flavin-dependent dehydrogenase